MQVGIHSTMKAGSEPVPTTNTTASDKKKKGAAEEQDLKSVEVQDVALLDESHSQSNAEEDGYDAAKVEEWLALLQPTGPGYVAFSV